MEHVIVNGEVIILNYIKRISEPEIHVWLHDNFSYFPVKMGTDYRGSLTLYLIDKTEHVLVYSKFKKVEDLVDKYWGIVDDYKKLLSEGKGDIDVLISVMNPKLTPIIADIKATLTNAVLFQRDRIVANLERLDPIRELN